MTSTIEIELMKKTILITGVAGFIGFHLAKHIMDIVPDVKIIGFDNLNSYYNVALKQDRIVLLQTHQNFTFIKGDIADSSSVSTLFKTYHPDIVVHLAAQAGVRYSIDHPDTYIDSNIIGTFNILEACRYCTVRHLVYASSSSVYGSNLKIPYSTSDMSDNPVSLYAATKKSCELMAYAYSKLYDVSTTGLRFFTVYGPWGRPDMAYFSFTEKMVNGEPIRLFNYGKLKRDFTYIDDIVEGVYRVMQKPPAKDVNGASHRIYNIGNHSPIALVDFVNILEASLISHNIINVPTQREYLPMQPGDVYQTFADMTELAKDFGISPKTSLVDGLDKFAQWYKEWKTKV